MPQLTPEDLLRREYGSSKNIMTPSILSYGWIVPFEMAYELSTGDGISREQIWGVSIVRKDDTKLRGSERVFELSDCFRSLKAAMDHIDRLRRNGGRKEPE